MLHVNEKVRVDEIGPTDPEPAEGLPPDQAPEATHDPALAEFHLRVDEPLPVTIGGSATRVTMGRASSRAHEAMAPMASVATSTLEP